MVAIDVVHWFSLSIGELLHQKKIHHELSPPYVRSANLAARQPHAEAVAIRSPIEPGTAKSPPKRCPEDSRSWRRWVGGAGGDDGSAVGGSKPRGGGGGGPAAASPAYRPPCSA